MYPTLTVRRLLVCQTLSFATAVAVLGVARPAAAKNQLSFDAGADFPSPSGSDNGFGVGMRFGHKWDIPLLSLVPELGLRYSKFGGPSDVSTFSVVGGGRIGVSFVLEPSVFAHAGIGHLWGPTSTTNLAYDVGAALDITALPVIQFGPHLMLAGIAGSQSQDAFSWLELGGHLTVNFGQ